MELEMQPKQPSGTGILQRRLFLIFVVGIVFLASFILYLVLRGGSRENAATAKQDSLMAVWIPIWFAVWIPVLVAKQKEVEAGKAGKFAILGVGFAVIFVLAIGVGLFCLIRR